MVWVWRTKRTRIQVRSLRKSVWFEEQRCDGATTSKDEDLTNKEPCCDTWIFRQERDPNHVPNIRLIFGVNICWVGFNAACKMVSCFSVSCFSICIFIHLHPSHLSVSLSDSNRLSICICCPHALSVCLSVYLIYLLTFLSILLLICRWIDSSIYHRVLRIYDRCGDCRYLE